MADFIMLVAKKDTGALKQGDILCVLPAKHQLNDEEKKEYLVIPITGMTEYEAGKLYVPQWDNGLDEIDFTSKTPVKMLAKRKHKVNLADMEAQATTADIAFDSEKAIDTKENYQPFVDAKLLVEPKSVDFVTDKATDTYRKDYSSTSVTGDGK